MWNNMFQEHVLTTNLALHHLYGGLCLVAFSLTLKVAEHSFQVPMPNSPLLLNHLCFGARFLQESRLTTQVFILAFWQGCVLLPWQWGWLKTKMVFAYLKKIQSLDFFHRLPTTN